MKKVFWSTFALSLMTLLFRFTPSALGAEDFLGLEAEIMPALKGDQRFTSPDMHESKSWNVEEEKVIIDRPHPHKGQGHSIIPWKELDPEEWLSIDKWLTERTIKDDIPEWKIRLREAGHKELVGKILKCTGSCHVFRGTEKASVQHLSRIHEGDELETGKDTVVWVYLMDGSLMRVSPETSVSFHEINFSEKEIFILTRLNQGHVFWHPRTKTEYPYEYAPETDSYSLPLLIREANKEHFERLLFKEGKETRLLEVMNLDEGAIKNQISELNRIRVENSAHLGERKSRVMMVAPNGSLIGKEAGFDFLHVTGGSSWFKKRSMEEGDELLLHLRGYAATDVNFVTEQVWYEIQPDGRSYRKEENARPELQVLELLTKRIKTIELAREIWFKKFTVPVLHILSKPESLAHQFGYRHWYESEMEKRMQYLVEYTRRIETTNLRSIQNLLAKLEKNNERPPQDFSNELYQASLKHYLLGLKSRYDKDQLRVREMTNLFYYVWILRNGRF